MEHHTASTSPIPFSGEDWFDPLEEVVRFQVRAFIKALVVEEVEGALGGRKRYQRSGAPKGYRNGHRERQLVGTFGALTVSLPRARLRDGEGGETEWRSQTSISMYLLGRFDLKKYPGCQRRSKIRPAGRSKSSPPRVMRGGVFAVIPAVHRRDPRCFV
jgi:hypothetical protein